MAVTVVSAGGSNISSLFDGEIKSRKGRGLVVLFARPASVVKARLKKLNSKAELFFIDTVSRVDEESVITAVPEDLTGLSIAIGECAGAVNFVAFDLLNELSTYNSVDSVVRFSKFIIAKLRGLGVDCVVFVSSDGVDPKLSSALKQVADKIVKK